MSGDEQPAVRASDADRERVAARLRNSAVEGRLTPEELSDRLDVVLAARTMTELDAVITDLPREAGVPDLARQRAIGRQALLHRAGAALITDAVVVAIWLATGADGPFWPIWVIVFTLLPLARRGWRYFGPGGTLTDSELGRERRERAQARRERRRELSDRELRRRGLGP